MVDVSRLDSYLLRVPMLRHWQPLTTHVMVRSRWPACAVSSHEVALHTIPVCS